MFDNACLAHLRKCRAEESAAAASSGVEADPEKGQQHTAGVAVMANNHIGMECREQQLNSGGDGMSVVSIGNGHSETYVHKRRQ